MNKGTVAASIPVGGIVMPVSAKRRPKQPCAKGTGQSEAANSAVRAKKLAEGFVDAQVGAPIDRVAAGHGPVARPPSIHMLAAVYRERRAGDEVGLFCNQKEDGAGDVFGSAQSAHRNARNDFLEHVFGHGAHHFSIDVSRRDGVDRDVLARPLLG